MCFVATAIRACFILHLLCSSFSIILDFATVSSKGLLLYMQGNIHNDFFSLQVVSGQLLFSYDLGSGYAQIRTTGSYNDGMLHRASLLKLCYQQYKLSSIGGATTYFSCGPSYYGWWFRNCGWSIPWYLFFSEC